MRTFSRGPRWVGVSLALLLPSLTASAGPIFYDGFENQQSKTNYFKTGVGAWNQANNLVVPPAVPNDATAWGWVTTFGENVSVARHQSFNESIPGMVMNDVDPSDGVTNAVGGLVQLGSVLGGDYWDSAYPIGVVGEYYLGTGDVRPSRLDPWNFWSGVNNTMNKDVADDALTLDTWTKPLPLNKQSTSVRFVSFLLGGIGDTDPTTGLPNVFISVEMEPSTINGKSTGCTGAFLAPIPAGANGVSIYWGQAYGYKSIRDKILHNVPDQLGTTSQVAPGRDERMRLVIIDMWGPAFGEKGTNPRTSWCSNGRIRIVDRSVVGHLNADEIVLGSIDDLGARYPSAPFGVISQDRPPAVYGLADLHTHWMSHMGNGAQPRTTVTSPVSRTSLRGLMTAMGAMSGLPYQPSDTRIPDICQGVQLGSQSVTDLCPAVGANGMGGPGTSTTSCNPANGTCVLSAGQREALALAACDGEYHALRSTYPGNDYDYDDAEFKYYGDRYYRGQEASATLLQELAPAAGNTHTDQALGNATQDAYHGPQGYDADSNVYLYPARPFLGKIHQQMYWTWLKRAWRGGLRLIVTDVIHSMPLDLLLNEWWMIETHGNDDPGYGHASDEQYALQRQTCAVKKLVGTASELNTWAQVVFDPQGARDVIARGKLAIVLGAELDSQGSLRVGLNSNDPIKSEIEFMQSLGIRKVTPVHQVDNRLGGPALFQGVLVFFNDALNLPSDSLEGGNCISAINWSRKFDAVNSPTHFLDNQFILADVGPPSDDKWGTNFFPDTYAHVGNGQMICTLAYNAYRPGPNLDYCDPSNPACIPDFNYFNLDFDPVEPAGDQLGFSMPLAWASLGFVHAGQLFPYVHAQLEDDAPFVGRLHGYIAKFIAGQRIPSSPSQRYADFLNGPLDQNQNPVPTINQLGLQPIGQTYVAALMAHGMLIDAEHLGEHSRDGTFQIAWNTGTDGLPCNQGAGGLTVQQRHSLPQCQANAYPILATHAQLRWPESDIYGLRDERSWRRDEVTDIMQTGGLVGINTGYDFIDKAAMPAEAGHDFAGHNDCPGSSKAWAQHYLAYVAQGEAGPSNGNPVFFDFGASGVTRPPHWASRGGAFGSDMNGFASQLGSRFNPYHQNNCYGGIDFRFDPAADGKQESNNLFQVAAADGVAYLGFNEAFTDRSVNPGAGLWPQPKLTPGVPAMPAEIILAPNTADNEPNNDIPIGSDFFDFNEMGLAHIGLFPDLLQDAINPMREDLGTFTDMQYQMRYFWRGAEDFIEAWEKSIAVCKATNLANPNACTPVAPNDAATCDLWASDLDGGGHMFDLLSQVGKPAAEANQPSCMARCGQELSYTEFVIDPQSHQVVPQASSCRCWIHPGGGDGLGKELDSPLNKYTYGNQTLNVPICNDFKQWCQHVYNYDATNEGYLDWDSP